MTPDYTYGHTVTKSVNDYLTANGGWTMVTNQVSPLGTQDFSQYLTNIANSGAEFIINVNWGRDAVLSVQQAKQFGLTPKMKMVIPYQIPFLAKEVGPELTEGVFAATDFWWTLEDKYPLAKMFVDGLREEVRLQAGMGRRERLHAVRHLGAHGLRSRHLLSAGRSSSSTRRARPSRRLVGDVHFRPEDHQLVRPVIIVRGKAPKDMKNKEDYLGGARSRAGRAADAEAGRLRLPARRLHLTTTIAFSALRRRGEGSSFDGGRADRHEASASSGTAIRLDMHAV